MYLIAGLGNPGSKYENTRHNMGFKTVDNIASELGVDIRKSKFKGLIGEGKIGKEKVLLLKPQTYMNLSGESVREAAMYYDIPRENLIVIYDDMDLPAGDIRIRKSGGPGTHNGMKSVVSQLGIKDFPRIRVGVGSGLNGDDIVNHVIGKVSQREMSVLEDACRDAATAACDIVRIGIDNAMNRHNGKAGKELKETGNN